MVNDTANTTRKYRFPELPPCVYNVDGSKTSSSQNGDSPDWSLGHLVSQRASPIGCEWSNGDVWLKGSIGQLSPEQNVSRLRAAVTLAPPTVSSLHSRPLDLCPVALNMCWLRLTLYLYLWNNQYSLKKSDNHWWIPRSTPSLAPGQPCFLKCTDDPYDPAFSGRNPSCYALSKKNGSLLCPPVENVCSLADVLILYISKGRSWEAWVLALIFNIIKFEYAYGK